MSDRVGRAALGFRAHAGWAAAVAIAGGVDAPVVVDRRKIVIVEGGTEAAQIYHAAADLPARAGEELVARVSAAAAKRAREAVAALIRDLAAAGHPVEAAGLAWGGAKLPPALADILASHALIHAAEGALYRRVLAEAARAAKLRVATAPAKEVTALLAATVGGRDVTARIAAAGKGLGPPWGADQKEAFACAWLALASKEAR